MTATGWFVLVERSELVGGSYNYGVAKTIPAGDEESEAWALALETARTHGHFGYERDHTREIYRAPDGALRVIFRDHRGWVGRDLRVSVAELVEVREPEAPTVDKETDAQKRRFGRFRR
ncbi:hypothetical protein ACIRFH_30645 [Streptomyces sp. NPDC093586]|uniref:hypothetical protein n=1 Tax=Streptomyces sp. NPDC093586 TaxID=3366042 RepID=UPI00380C6BB1